MSLSPLHFEPLPLGAIFPCGWLRDQLQAQADGLTGHLDEFWPSVAQSRWIGGEAEGWERGPYWLDGLIPLAFLLEDARLKAKAQHWIDYILEHQHADGWLGAKDDGHVGLGQSGLDPWPQYVLFKVFRQWHEATGDPRIVPATLRAMRRIHELLQTEALQSWARMRWMELVLSVHWIYEATREEWLLDLAALLHEQGFDWREHFADFKATQRTTREQLADGTHALELHGVNNAMGLKAGPVWWRQSRDDEERDGIFDALDVLDRYHGQATGMFSADEHFAGLNPSQGTELCTVVELMYTLELAFAATGNRRLAERLERIAFNALPGGCTPDMRAHVYHQQINQVLCDVSRRDWVSSGLDANLYGLEPNFGCCTANLHQGWPKLATHAWMKSHDCGLVAVTYTPVEVTTTSADGTPVRVTVETDYPFREVITLVVHADAPTRCPLYLRIPPWAQEATLRMGDETVPVVADDYLLVDRIWQGETRLTLTLPMPVQIEKRATGVTLSRGPLVFGLQIVERQEQVKTVDGWADYAYYPESRWNVALTTNDVNAVTVQMSPVGTPPFDTAHVPVALLAPVRQVPAWGMKDNSADLPPSEPVATGETESATFVPFGFARLRVTELPQVA